MSAFHLYLDIDGVTGESVTHGHEGAVELSSWSFGLRTAASVGGSGAGAGKTRWDTIDVTMPTTAALPQFMSLCATGRLVKHAVLRAETASGESPFEWLRLTLTDVLVAHVASGASAPDDRSDDQASLAFSSIMIEKFSRGPDGTLGVPVTFAWNARKGKAAKTPA